MELKKLLAGIELIDVPPIPSFVISKITYDSRKVEPSSLFVALRGLQSDGHQFISQAIEKGSAVIVGEEGSKEREEGRGILFLRVKNSRIALAKLASNFYQAPTQSMKVVGITGTNGKTTTSYLVESILKEAGFSPAVIGTVNLRHAGKVFPSTHTTPESLDLESFIAERKKEACDSLVMEVSSHAIHQHRVDEIDFDVGVFTNLTPDHLDYHHSMEEYFDAKARFFRELLLHKTSKKKSAVLNYDDEWVQKLLKEIRIPFLSFSISSSKADLYPLSKRIGIEGIESEIHTPQGVCHLKSRLLGDFNLSNLLAAVATGLALDLPLSKIEKALNTFQSVPGRLERVENKKGIHVFVDYAHTPDALKNVLETLREILVSECHSHPSRERGKLITVFGCGGDRDKTKRPLMGKEVAELADFGILTSDNPRTEDPQQIIQEVLPGLVSKAWKEGSNYRVEVDRKKAIALALKEAKPGDIVLIAGKGHEDYQIIGKTKIHFDDREVVREYLK